LGAKGVVALRLPSIFATLGTLSLVGFFTRKIEAVMILSVSVLFMGVGRMFMPDSLLVFGMTLALFSFWKSREDERWHVVTAVGLAVSVLAKGPMPLAVYVLLWLYCRFRLRWKPNHGHPDSWTKRATHIWKSSAVFIFLSAVVPWYLIVSTRSPEFISQFLVRQNLGRLTGAGDSMHLGQFWFYIPIVFVGLLPFSLSLVGAWRKREGDFEAYLWAYVWIVFILFSLAGSKLPHYILPIFPALAILIQRHLFRKERLVWDFSAILFLAFLSLGIAFFFNLQLPLGQLASILSLTTIVSIIVSPYLTRRSRSISLGFAAMAPISLTCLLVGPGLYWERTHSQAIQVARAAVQTGCPIVEYRTGGERQSGKTSHPSMQWTIGQNTEPADNVTRLTELASTDRIAVISRDGRLEHDLRIDPSPRLRVQKKSQDGEFELYIVEAQ
jgi:4-amino-4-deoxy-L-arabinose transferase-like glycosyltransferase